MYWLFLWLLSVWEIKQDRFMPSRTEITLDWKSGSQSDNPSLPLSKPWRNCSCPAVQELLEMLFTCWSQVCSTAFPLTACPQQHLFLRTCHLYMHKVPALTAFLGLPHFMLHCKASLEILSPKLIAQMTAWYKQDIFYLLFATYDEAGEGNLPSLM